VLQENKPFTWKRSVSSTRHIVQVTDEKGKDVLFIVNDSITLLDTIPAIRMLVKEIVLKDSLLLIEYKKVHVIHDTVWKHKPTHQGSELNIVGTNNGAITVQN
jgi:sulfur relay (sulfurtransferase) DsrC/TusE family protein